MKCFSLAKMFNDPIIGKLNVTKMYTEIKEYDFTHQGEHDNYYVMGIRIRKNQHLVIAVHIGNKQMKLRWYNHDLTWEEQRNIEPQRWGNNNLTIMAPEFAAVAGLKDNRNSHNPLASNLYLFKYVIRNYELDEKSFNDLLRRSMIETEQPNQVFMIPYEGEPTKRQGDYSYLTGFSNGILLKRLGVALNKMDDTYSSPVDIAAFNYAGLLIPYLTLDELNTLNDYLIRAQRRLTSLSGYYMKEELSRTESNRLHMYSQLLEEQKMQLLLASEQTMTYSQYQQDPIIAQQIDNGARVNIVIDMAPVTDWS